MRTKLLLVATLSILGTSAAQAKDCEPNQPCQASQNKAHANSSHTNAAQPTSAQNHSSSKGATPNSAHQQQSQPQQAKTQSNSNNAQSQGKYRVIAKNLNIRGEPKNGAKVYGSFRNDDKIDVYAIINGWAKILYNGEYLWVSSEYLQRVDK